MHKLTTIPCIFTVINGFKIKSLLSGFLASMTCNNKFDKKTTKKKDLRYTKQNQHKINNKHA